MKKKFLAIILCILLINILYLWYLSSKVIHIDQNTIAASNYTAIQEFEHYTLFNELSTLEDLEDISDVILRVKVTAEKKIAPKDIITTAVITKVYKGEGLSVQDSIQIIEPYYYEYTTYAIGGYVPITENTDYIVFLKPTTLHNTYLFSSVEFGKFKADALPAKIFELDKEAISVKEISNYDFVYIYGPEDDELGYHEVDGKKYQLTIIHTKDLAAQFHRLKNESNQKYSD